MERKFDIIFGACCTFGLVLAMTQASAAEAEQPSNERTARTQDTAGLEEIVVTARKREESAQKVPAAITAFSAAALEREGKKELRDIGYMVPNVIFNDSNSSTGNFSIRGISSDSSNTGIDSSVGAAVDEVFIGRLVGLPQQFLDVERVELLRGPQGVLFGKNTIAGVLSIVTKKPTAETTAEFKGSYGNYNAYEASAVLGGTIIEDKLFGRVAMQRVQHRGYLRNRFGGTGYLSDNLEKYGNNQDLYNIRGQLLAPLGAATTARLILDFSENHETSNMFDTLAGREFDGSGYDRVASWDFPSYDRLKTRGASLQIESDLGWGKFTSISSYRSYKSRFLRDTDFTERFLLVNGRDENQKQWSQEFRLAGSLSSNLEYVAGLYYFHQSIDSKTTSRRSSAANTNRGETLVLTFGDVSGDSYAAFGSVTWRPVEPLKIDIGGRYTRETKDFALRQTVTPTGIVSNPVYPLTRDKLAEGKFTPAVTVSYYLADQAFVYGQFSQGYKSGGFNTTRISSLSALHFDAEQVDNFEAGFKSTLFDNHLRFNLAAYYLKYKNMQQSQYDGAEYVVRNASSAHSQGVEAEIAYATDFGLELTGSVGHSKAIFDSFVVDATDDESGNDLPRAPRWTWATGATYRGALSDGLNLTLHGDATYRGPSYIDTVNSPQYRQQKATLFNARASIEASSGAWSVGVFGRNLSDKKFIIGGFTSGTTGTQYITLNTPRTYGVEASFKF